MCECVCVCFWMLNTQLVFGWQLVVVQASTHRGVCVLYERVSPYTTSYIHANILPLLRLCLGMCLQLSV